MDRTRRGGAVRRWITVLRRRGRVGVGAATQVLKVEIGGDTNSTPGAEPSDESTRGVVDCTRGYEWWLAGQAKARNPNIKLYALSWARPAGSATATSGPPT